MPADLSTTTLALLQDPYAFTQTRLLSPESFAREAKKRGVSLDRGQLELLHRRRVLQPFYEVHSRPVTEPRQSRLPAGVFDSALQEIHFALAAGRLSDPALRRYSPWTPSRSHRSHWYSYHQLLTLRSLRYLQAKMQARQTADKLVWDLSPLNARDRGQFASERSLAFLIEALASKYRPRVVKSIRLSPGADEEEWSRFVGSNEQLPRMLEISLSSHEYVRQADRLLADAGSFDPLGAWSQVVRVADPRRWEDLRYDALVAHDYRVAAECLLRYAEEQARLGLADPPDAPPTSLIHPRPQRLRVDARDRAETIMRFGISDRPTLVLAVEGHAEYEIAPRVLKMMGHDPPASRIVIVNLESIKGNVKLLARAVSVPQLVTDRHGYACLLSPLTSLMVAVDPESSYASPESEETVKASMIDSVLRSLPPPLRSDGMQDDLAQILCVRRWPAEFEFAHWNDSELAEALQKISRIAADLPPGELRRRISEARSAGGTIKSVWANWRPQPSKVRLAQTLWPALERRIWDTSTPDDIPIVRVIREAISMAHRTSPDCSRVVGWWGCASAEKPL